METFCYCGVYFEIDDELAACIEREKSAWIEGEAARSETRAVLDRKLANGERAPIISQVHIEKKAPRAVPRMRARLKRSFS